MIQTATLLDRTQYEVINFDVIARDVNIDETTQQQQTATGEPQYPLYCPKFRFHNHFYVMDASNLARYHKNSVYWDI